MTQNIAQPIDRRTITRKALLAGVARSIGAIARVDKRFSERGWPKDDRKHIATAAVCYVKMGIGMQRFKIAPGTDDALCWASLVPSATADQIVDALELTDLLEAEKIISIVKP